METIKITSSRSYEVVIDKDYSHLLAKIKEIVNGKIAVVYDGNTYVLFREKIKKILSKFETVEVVVPCGETSKSPEQYFRIISVLRENCFTRNDFIMAVGGGVVGDLCGFVASSYMRGIGYISCPTTLLSCIDSSVGGKTAINFDGIKNLVGSFYQPNLVYISISAMKTLLFKEVECGMGEAVKYAFIDGNITAEDIKGGINEKLVYKCVNAKKAIVEEDEFDKGVRAKLNLGHTVGHAIESLSGYEYSHGLCVYNGIRKIIEISCKFYGLSEDKKEEFYSLLNSYPFSEQIDYEPKKLIEKIALDKKNQGDYINLVLIKDIGDLRIEKIGLAELEKLL